MRNKNIRSYDQTCPRPWRFTAGTSMPITKTSSRTGITKRTPPNVSTHHHHGASLSSSASFLPSLLLFAKKERRHVTCRCWLLITMIPPPFHWIWHVDLDNAAHNNNHETLPPTRKLSLLQHDTVAASKANIVIIPYMIYFLDTLFTFHALSLWHVLTVDVPIRDEHLQEYYYKKPHHDDGGRRLGSSSMETNQRCFLAPHPSL